MRRPVKVKYPDPVEYVHNSPVLAQFINYVMLGGEKETARKVVYNSLDYISKKEKTDKPLEVFEKAIENVSPLMEVRSRRIGGANYQVPREVTAKRRLSLSMRWILGAARSKKGKPLFERLGEELILASKNEGEAVRKRENTHKMAESNKAFAHFSW